MKVVSVEAPWMLGIIAFMVLLGTIVAVGVLRRRHR
jgi:hypothetical protein